jgi:hypothetical protein
MRFSRPLVALAVVAISFAGCSSTPNPSAGATGTGTPSATAANTLTIYYEENCQVELIAPSEQLVAPSGGIGSATRSDPARPISPETDQTQELGVELRHRSQLD